LRLPQIVVFENDGSIAAHLKPLVAERRWLLREPRQGPACLHILKAGGPAVLVLKLGRHLLRELTLLDQAAVEAPDVPVVVVHDAEDAAIMSLALDLGATYILMPPHPRRLLPLLVEKMLCVEIDRSQQVQAAVPRLLAMTAEEADHAD
jgi:DNA-binding NtrC family response regulator